MLMYHLFYSVKKSKSSYTETKVFTCKKDALEELIKLCQCANVEFVSIREVYVKSINLEVYKHPDNFEIEGKFEDLQPSIDFSNVDMNLVNSSYTGDFQINNPLPKTRFNDYLKKSFEKKPFKINMSDLRELNYNFKSTEKSYKKCNREKCKKCTEYKKDVFYSKCKDCKYFSQLNSKDLFSKLEVENAKQ